VRAAGVVAIDGVRYWRTSQGDLIDASRIVQIAPSTFKGIAIEDAEHMPAWVHAHHDPYKPAPLRAEPSPRAPIVAELAPRTVVDLQDTSDDGAFVRVSESLWIARVDVRVAAVASPPAGIGDDDKWFDVDRDDQVLVAYEGTKPVYATLVSTGNWEHETRRWWRASRRSSRARSWRATRSRSTRSPTCRGRCTTTATSRCTPRTGTTASVTRSATAA
jgi:hypothetical protein